MKQAKPKTQMQWIFNILLRAGLGVWLLLFFGIDDRSRSWTRQHTEVIQAQLTGLSKLLQNHSATHGRYPTNDEGLATLNNFESKFTLYFPAEGHSSRDGYLWLRCGRFFWRHISDDIAEFRTKRGRAPKSSDNFFVNGSLPLDMVSGIGDDYISLPVAISGNSLFLPNPAGVVSPWFIPYGYENRRGLNAKLFDDSPADSDSTRCYSMRVDDGIYLYSIGGEKYAAKLRREWWIRNVPRGLGAILLLSAIYCIVVMIRSTGYGILAGPIAFVIASIAGLGAATLNHAMCYLPSPLFSRRTPEMVTRQKELLETYRQNGVLSQAAYDRAMEALAKGPAATKPVETIPKNGEIK